MNDARRIASLDGLRGIAAIAVMEFHFNLFFLPQARLSDIVPYLDRAYLAVDLFFLLSGFVMAHVYGQALATDWRAHWPKFAIARFARLYPLFAVTTLVMVMTVAASHTAMPVSLSARTLALQPFLLQQWAHGLSWNYPSWSISTEAEAYVFFVLFAASLLAGRHPRIIAACCSLILVAVSIPHDGSLLYFVGARALLRTIAEFSLGGLLYRAHSRGAVFPRRSTGICTIALAVLGLLSHQDILVVGAFGCLIYYCVNARDALTWLLNSRPALALGTWSYSIYLWHAPIHYLIMALFAAFGLPVGTLDSSQARLLLVTTTLLVVGIAAASYRYFETPLRRWILNLIPWMDRRRAANPAKPLAQT